jgi:hypothetical protein
MSPAPTSNSKYLAAKVTGWIWPALCCAFVLGCILIANPFNEAGFCDDWAYGRVAMKLAENGRFEYSGWGSPLLLVQAIWAAPWIRLFGFSFQVLQISMLPLSLGFVVLVYATGRQIGLSEGMAGFGAVFTGASPLFLPIAASFMTEACGCLFGTLCLYAAIRCARADTPEGAVRWLWVLTAAGLIGGANRQIMWIAPLALIPYLVWIYRDKASFRGHAAAAYGITAGSILTLLHFFGQPYGPLELGAAELVRVLQREWATDIKLLLDLLLLFSLSSLPVFCCFLSQLRRRDLGWTATILIGAAVLTVAEIAIAGILLPNGTQLLSAGGIAVPEQDSVDAKIPLIPVWLRLVLTVVANGCVLAVLCTFIRRRDQAKQLSGDRALHIFAIFTFGYVLLLMPGALIGFAFDRYLLPLLPIAALVGLKRLSLSRTRVPAVGWLCMLLFAGYAVATTHDYFAALRARVAAAHTLERNGITRSRISAGFEYDGWTQVVRWGHVGVARYEDRLKDESPKGFWFEFWDHAPDFHPDFVVLNSYFDKRPAKGVLQIDVGAWIPPFRRSVVVWRRSDLKYAEYLPR